VLRDIKIKLVTALVLVLFFSNGQDIVLNSFAQTEIHFTEKWSFEFERIYNDLSISDVDRDGSFEILFHGGLNLYCLDYKGKTKWSMREKHAALAFSIADVNEDGKLDFVIPYIGGGIVCRNHEGKKLWYFENYKYSRYAYPCIADLDNDNDLDIIINSEYNNPFILTKKGLLNKNYKLINEDLSSPLISIYSTPILVDIDLNNNNEMLIVTSDEYLHCFDSEGLTIWSFKLNNLGYAINYYSNPVLVKTSQGTINILLADHDELLCLNSTGKLVWKYGLNDTYQGYNPISSDIDNDGSPEILLRAFSGDSNTGILYCLDSDGNYKWSYMINDFPQEPIIADINNDNQLEILFAAGKKIHCLNSSGGIEYIYENNQQDGKYIVLRMADIDHNGYLDLIAATNKGELNCLEISSSYGSLVAGGPLEALINIMDNQIGMGMESMT